MFLEAKKISRAPQTPLRARSNVTKSMASCAKNITHTQHSPTCCFLCIQGVAGLHSQQSRATMPMDPLHQENFSVLTNFGNELQHSSKCPPSSTTLFFLQPCLSQSDIEYQYALSLNDKSSSCQKNCTMTVTIYPYSLLYQPNN
jgi:hypothetical protein